MKLNGVGVIPPFKWFGSYRVGEAGRSADMEITERGALTRAHFLLLIKLKSGEFGKLTWRSHKYSLKIRKLG
jgi:hypothetical protein